MMNVAWLAASLTTVMVAVVVAQLWWDNRG